MGALSSCLVSRGNAPHAHTNTSPLSKTLHAEGCEALLQAVDQAAQRGAAGVECSPIQRHLSITQRTAVDNDTVQRLCYHTGADLAVLNRAALDAALRALPQPVAVLYVPYTSTSLPTGAEPEGFAARGTSTGQHRSWSGVAGDIRKAEVTPGCDGGGGGGGDLQQRQQRQQGAGTAAAASSQSQSPHRHLVITTEHGSTALGVVLSNGAAVDALQLTDEYDILRFLERAFERDSCLRLLFQDIVNRLLQGNLHTVHHFVPGDFGRGRYFLSLRVSAFVYQTSTSPGYGSNTVPPASGQPSCPGAVAPAGIPGVHQAPASQASGSQSAPPSTAFARSPTAAHLGSGAVTPAMILELDVPYEGKELAARLQRDYMIISNIPSIVTMFDVEGRVVHQNRASIAYMGHMVGLEQQQQRHSVRQLQLIAPPELPPGQGYPPGAGEGPGPNRLQQLFTEDPAKLREVMEALTAGSGEWRGLVRMADGMRYGARPRDALPSAAPAAVPAALAGSNADGGLIIVGGGSGGKYRGEQGEEGSEAGGNATSRSLRNPSGGQLPAAPDLAPLATALVLPASPDPRTAATDGTLALDPTSALAATASATAASGIETASTGATAEKRLKPDGVARVSWPLAHLRPMGRRDLSANVVRAMQSTVRPDTDGSSWQSHCPHGADVDPRSESATVPLRSGSGPDKEAAAGEQGDAIVAGSGVAKGEEADRVAVAAESSPVTGPGAVPLAPAAAGASAGRDQRDDPQGQEGEGVGVGEEGLQQQEPSREDADGAGVLELQPAVPHGVDGGCERTCGARVDATGAEGASSGSSTSNCAGAMLCSSSAEPNVATEAVVTLAMAEAEGVRLVALAAPPPAPGPDHAVGAAAGGPEVDIPPGVLDPEEGQSSRSSSDGANGEADALVSPRRLGEAAGSPEVVLPVLTLPECAAASGLASGPGGGGGALAVPASTDRTSVGSAATMAALQLLLRATGVKPEMYPLETARESQSITSAALDEAQTMLTTDNNFSIEFMTQNSRLAGVMAGEVRSGGNGSAGSGGLWRSGGRFGSRASPRDLQLPPALRRIGTGATAAIAIASGGGGGESSKPPAEQQSFEELSFLLPKLATTSPCSSPNLSAAAATKLEPGQTGSGSPRRRLRRFVVGHPVSASGSAPQSADTGATADAVEVGPTCPPARPQTHLGLRPAAAAAAAAAAATAAVGLACPAEDAPLLDASAASAAEKVRLSQFVQGTGKSAAGDPSRLGPPPPLTVSSPPRGQGSAGNTETAATTATATVTGSPLSIPGGLAQAGTVPSAATQVPDGGGPAAAPTVSDSGCPPGLPGISAAGQPAAASRLSAATASGSTGALSALRRHATDPLTAAMPSPRGLSNADGGGGGGGTTAGGVSAGVLPSRTNSSTSAAAATTTTSTAGALGMSYLQHMGGENEKWIRTVRRALESSTSASIATSGSTAANALMLLPQPSQAQPHRYSGPLSGSDKLVVVRTAAATTTTTMTTMTTSMASPGMMANGAEAPLFAGFSTTTTTTPFPRQLSGHTDRTSGGCTTMDLRSAGLMSTAAAPEAGAAAAAAAAAAAGSSGIWPAVSAPLALISPKMEMSCSSGPMPTVVSVSQKLTQLLMNAQAGGSAADDAGTAAAMAAAAASRGLGRGVEAPTGPAAAGGGCRWHEVHVRRCFDPISSEPLTMVIQTDVTSKVRAEAFLAAVLEAEHRLLADIFPSHVVQVMTRRRQDEALLERSGLTLLRNIPDPAALATQHDSVTVLFADIKGFTEMSKAVPATSVMTFLNDLYTRFDSLTDVYGVYKVETIGDCYMVAGGLMARDEAGGYGRAVRRPGEADPLHAMRVVAFARAMLEEAAKVALPNTGEPVQMRVGIHSGSAMSGVVGQKMPRFCLFGDTINTASRMESTGTPGAIHVSAATRSLLPPEEDDQLWAATGGVEVKGKGRMDTYLWSPRTRAANRQRRSMEQRARLLGTLSTISTESRQPSRNPSRQASPLLSPACSITTPSGPPQSPPLQPSPSRPTAAPTASQPPPQQQLQQQQEQQQQQHALQQQRQQRPATGRGPTPNAGGRVRGVGGLAAASAFDPTSTVF